MATPRTAPDRSSWPLLLTAHALLVERMEARLAAAQLPDLACYDVLWALERAPERRLRMSELAHQLVFTRSNLTRLVDRLEAAGWVARDRDCEDRRGAYAVLLDAGQALRRRMWPVYQAAIEELYERHLTADESAMLRAALKRVIAAAREGEPASRAKR